MACRQITKTVAAGDTANMLDLIIADTSSALLGLTISDTTNTDSRSMIVHVSYSGVSPTITPYFVEYGIVGIAIPFDLDVVYDQPNEKLTVVYENTHANDVRVDLTEIGST